MLCKISSKPTLFGEVLPDKQFFDSGDRDLSNFGGTRSWEHHHRVDGLCVRRLLLIGQAQRTTVLNQIDFQILFSCLQNQADLVFGAYALTKFVHKQRRTIHEIAIKEGALNAVAIGERLTFGQTDRTVG